MGSQSGPNEGVSLKQLRFSLQHHEGHEVPIKTKKDLRQGDPLPPFFFIIILEARSCMLDRSGEWGAFSFLP